METCLKAAFSKPKSGAVRVSIMNRESAWKMLDKPLRAHLVIAAHEQEPPASDDEEDDNAPRRPTMNRPRGRMRRSGRQTGPAHMSWLHDPKTIIDESPYTTAYQLATLLVHKQMDQDNWDEAWNSHENLLRETCMVEGVHPVWHTIGEKTPLLGQFLAFPKAKVKSVKKTTKMGTDFFWIDPRNKDDVITVLKLASAGVDDPDVKVAMQKATHQISGARTVDLDGPLGSLTDSLSFITILLALHGGQAIPEKALKAGKKADAELAEALVDFERLVKGNVNDWSAILSLEREDSLSQARRSLAWQQAPSEAEACTSEQLEQGLALLQDAHVHEGRDRLTWWRLNALLREGKEEEAMDVLEGRRLDASSDVTELLPLLTSLSNDRATGWLMQFMDDVDQQALLHIMMENALATDLRIMAAQRLCDEQGPMWEEGRALALVLLLEKLDLHRLAKVFTSDPMLPLTHPYIALLVSHLAPASIDSALRDPIFTARNQALQSIQGAEVPAFLSPLAEHLLLLMEGTYKDTPEVGEVLNASALKAFSPISRALAGDGVVSATHIRNMGNSLDGLDLTLIERRLFDVMLLSLTMNGHLRAYNIGMAKPNDVAELDALLEDPVLPLRLIQSYSVLIVEHDLGLSNLVGWYQKNDPLSPWAPLARAALFASKGDELNSAREYSRTAELFAKQRKAGGSYSEGDAEDNDFVLSLPLTLYRKSLIHYAHAKSWAEAVDLLERVPALKTAITERFKLYLRVCHTSATDTNAAARMIRQHVQQRKTVLEEDVEGNMIEKTRTSYNEEELDLLRNYPFEQAHLLPPEPFLGRVTAASTRISRDLRRTRTQFEHQFRQAMQGSSPSMEEIYEIAKNAAEEGAFEGLMYLERAQNSTKFSITARNRLAGVEQALFSQYKDDIPTSKRRFLHNLSLTPLIIIDTNVLVDALVEKMYQHMDLVFETNLNIIGSNRFHRILLHHAEAKHLAMMIPDDVRGELKQFAKDRRLLPRFKSAMVNAEKLENTLSESVMMGLVDSVLSEYNTWSPSSDMLAGVQDSSEHLDTFLLRHSDVFEELTELKGYRGVTYRTELEGRAIYPEATDLDIYRLATHLASLPLPNIGAVMVATMDGDFTLVDRAIEERFGFSIAKNNRSLKPWLKRSTN